MPRKRNPLGLAQDQPSIGRKRKPAKSFEQNAPGRFEQQTARGTWPNTQGVVGPSMTKRGEADAGGAVKIGNAKVPALNAGRAHPGDRLDHSGGKPILKPNTDAATRGHVPVGYGDQTAHLGPLHPHHRHTPAGKKMDFHSDLAGVGSRLHTLNHLERARRRPRGEG